MLMMVSIYVSTARRVDTEAMYVVLLAEATLRKKFPTRSNKGSNSAHAKEVGHIKSYCL